MSLPHYSLLWDLFCLYIIVIKCVTECVFLLLNALYIHCAFALPSPSEFSAEIITNTLQYNMICDPLLKLLVILYIMSLNALN